MNFVFLNGQLIPSEAATISVSDRSFLYGDGLFETLRVAQGRPQLWDAHWARLTRGADFLRIGLPAIKGVEKLLEANDCVEGVLRIHLSRGVGPRGYSARGADSPMLLMSTHPLPPPPGSWKLATTAFHLPPANPLSGFKTANKLLNILAKTEAERKGADEGLLFAHSGEVAQGASSNLFWIEGQTVCTAPEQAGVLPGVTRATVLASCERLKIPVRLACPAALGRAAGVFMTLSTFGIVEASALDGQPLPRSPLTEQLQRQIIF